MSGILGKKIGMTRIFQDDGRVIPITVVECSPNEVTQVKTVDKDGYPAIVLGFSKMKKPCKTKKFYHLREFKIKEAEADNYKKGDQVSLEAFQEIERIKISSISKGKGFQGVIRRHNFSRGPESHGSHHHREPGSVGTCAKPGRVAKGKKLPGRMGGARVSSKTKVVSIDLKNNIICLKGAVPGPNGGLVILQTT
ncbi:50S ribosomal protein L3 [Candidatus Peregrinibacteria bacterium]|nr:50S ribosomal protein L3 [Candidatus Peregrinibacteria bacterium]